MPCTPSTPPGVHPLMLAIGSERYTPYETRASPVELLTQANAILGQGQMSLAKYLLIVNGQDAPELDIHDMGAFLQHLLQRVDWRRDLHFQTRTTIDTLDYSGTRLEPGLKSWSWPRPAACCATCLRDGRPMASCRKAFVIHASVCRACSPYRDRPTHGTATMPCDVSVRTSPERIAESLPLDRDR